MEERDPEFKIGDQVLANTRRGQIRVVIARIDPLKGFHLFAFDDGVNLGFHKRDHILYKLEKIFTD